MITLSKSGNTISFEFENNGHYLYNGTIDVPVNSLSLITDESDMATFKKSASNDIFISALYSDFGMTKSELESWYKANMVGSTGGGGTGGTTPEEVQQMINSSLTDYYDKDDVDGIVASAKTEIEGEIPTVPTNVSSFNNDAGYITDDALSGYAESTAVTQAISEAVSGKVDTTAFTAYSASVESTLSGKLSVSDFNTYSGAVDTSINSRASQSDLTAHTSNTNVHVTASDKANWNAKTDTSVFTAYTAATDSRLGEDEEVTAAALNALEESLSGKQDTLSAGTNITISGNVISAEGGGKAVTGGTNISVTTGATADTINCTLPISADTKGIYTTYIYPFEGSAFKSGNVVFGANNKIKKYGSSAECYYNLMFGEDNSLGNNEYTGNLRCNLVGGQANTVYGSAYYSTVLGYSNIINNSYQTVFGKYNVSSSGSTTADKSLFSVGNGTGDNARHNALEIRQNGDIYLNNGTSDVKLQEYLQIKAVQITQSDYDQLQTKDPNTLYVIVN